jgi:hypothetical protein
MKAIGTTGLFYSEGSGCVIARNTLDGIGSYGMFLQTYRCTLRDNVVSGAGAGGFGIQQNGDDNLILNNVVANGGDRGFAISGDRNNVEGNVANNNGSFGFTIFGTATLYRGNMARGNLGVAGDPPACAAPCSPDLCAPAALGNTSAGDNFLPGPPGFPACI